METLFFASRTEEINTASETQKQCLICELDDYFQLHFEFCLQITLYQIINLINVST